ncbi:YbaK/EbsC family protein [Peptostreptococcus equinus]|uniref:Prolyl-tRNA synthetase associated domain-containing protein n=1 Tax=Peptostreptococcus equinus TaxID=3003601 RepID=A0ABY7JTS0_9FIRM|nr:YbaK/EbsC family protein [Peptostreptococcus sp. CBA3647]WAW15375.1 prolyl-tRNA synthetase associated domain-containing protein [Peptostreptococcus sp. CBA3647]
MNKTEIFKYIDELKIWHEVTEHPAVFNMDKISRIELPYSDSDAKNLFVCDDKKINYYLITVKENKRVNLKDFRQNHNTHALSFESDSDLMDVMELIPDAVTTLGVLNDKKCKVQSCLDEEFIKKTSIIDIHLNDNTAKVWIKK